VRHAQRLDDRGVRFTVDEASTAMLAILQKLRQEGIEVESTEQYVPPFDDVFVALIRQGGKEAA
jgi:predicted peroxiredoxin